MSNKTKWIIATVIGSIFGVVTFNFVKYTNLSVYENIMISAVVAIIFICAFGVKVKSYVFIDKGSLT